VLAVQGLSTPDHGRPVDGGVMTVWLVNEAPRAWAGAFGPLIAIFLAWMPTHLNYETVSSRATNQAARSESDAKRRTCPVGSGLRRSLAASRSPCRQGSYP